MDRRHRSSSSSSSNIITTLVTAIVQLLLLLNVAELTRLATAEGNNLPQQVENSVRYNRYSVPPSEHRRRSGGHHHHRLRPYNYEDYDPLRKEASRPHRRRYRPSLKSKTYLEYGLGYYYDQVVDYDPYHHGASMFQPSHHVPSYESPHFRPPYQSMPHTSHPYHIQGLMPSSPGGLFVVPPSSSGPPPDWGILNDVQQHVRHKEYFAPPPPRPLSYEFQSSASSFQHPHLVPYHPLALPPLPSYHHEPIGSFTGRFPPPPQPHPLVSHRPRPDFMPQFASMRNLTFARLNAPEEEPLAQESIDHELDYSPNALGRSLDTVLICERCSKTLGTNEDLYLDLKLNPHLSPEDQAKFARDFGFVPLRKIEEEKEAARKKQTYVPVHPNSFVPMPSNVIYGRQVANVVPVPDLRKNNQTDSPLKPIVIEPKGLPIKLTDSIGPIDRRTKDPFQQLKNDTQQIPLPQPNNMFVSRSPPPPIPLPPPTRMVELLVNVSENLIDGDDLSSSSDKKSFIITTTSTTRRPNISPKIEKIPRQIGVQHSGQMRHSSHSTPKALRPSSNRASMEMIDFVNNLTQPQTKSPNKLLNEHSQHQHHHHGTDDIHDQWRIRTLSSPFSAKPNRSRNANVSKERDQWWPRVDTMWTTTKPVTRSQKSPSNRTESWPSEEWRHRHDQRHQQKDEAATVKQQQQPESKSELLDAITRFVALQKVVTNAEQTNTNDTTTAHHHHRHDDDDDGMSSGSKDDGNGPKESDDEGEVLLQLESSAGGKMIQQQPSLIDIRDKSFPSSTTSSSYQVDEATTTPFPMRLKNNGRKNDSRDESNEMARLLRFKPQRLKRSD